MKNLCQKLQQIVDSELKQGNEIFTSEIGAYQKCHLVVYLKKPFKAVYDIDGVHVMHDKDPHHGLLKWYYAKATQQAVCAPENL